MNNNKLKFDYNSNVLGLFLRNMDLSTKLYKLKRKDFKGFFKPSEYNLKILYSHKGFSLFLDIEKINNYKNYSLFLRDFISLIKSLITLKNAGYESGFKKGYIDINVFSLFLEDFLKVIQINKITKNKEDKKKVYKYIGFIIYILYCISIYKQGLSIYSMIELNKSFKELKGGLNIKWL